MASVSFLVLLSIFGVFFLNVSTFSLHNDYGSDEDELTPCDPNVCKPPDCSCFSVHPPRSMKVSEVPQFVMLTFDDAITVANIGTYEKIADGKRKNKANGCPIGMTFFVCHEYNDYKLANDLYKKGHEIAVHSITHESNTDMWKTSNGTRWQNEMVGMRTILSEFGKIPSDEIAGHRAPFLQTAGDVTFKMLKESNFLYDSSMPTRTYMDPPLWPYTLDHGYAQDCQIQPCPKSTYPGLWIVPMVQLKKVTVDKKTNKRSVFHCSMADACTPYPETAEDTKEYLMENFARHYLNNKAPFPIFLHEGWLRHEKRLEGYLDFLDTILEKDDVFVVPVHEVVNYMRNPISVSEYKNEKCFAERRQNAGDCKQTSNCQFLLRNRFMRSCKVCPKRYPWLDNPLGVKQTQ